jgi:hypothetical protein
LHISSTKRTPALTKKLIRPKTLGNSSADTAPAARTVSSTQIALQLGRMKCDRALPPLTLKKRPSRKINAPRFDVRAALYYVVGLDLTEIEGLNEVTALTIISEIGPGVSRFATVKQFCSWLGLCPNWRKTGGRVKSSRTRPGMNRAVTAFHFGVTGHILDHPMNNG